jgi:hypothetical protein
MGEKMKRGFVNIYVTVLVLSLSPILGIPFPAAGQQRQPPAETGTHKMGGPAWIEGKVTAKPSADSYRYVEVDGKTYTLMPDIRIVEVYQTQPGIMTERKIEHYQIRKGQRINMKVEGLRVYDIELHQ